MGVIMDVIVEDWSDDPSSTVTAIRGAYNQQGTWQFARGIKYAMDNICGDPTRVYIVMRNDKNGEELERHEITF